MLAFSRGFQDATLDNWALLHDVLVSDVEVDFGDGPVGFYVSFVSTNLPFR